MARNTVKESSIALENWISDQVRMAQMIAADSRVVAALKRPEDAAGVSKAQTYLKSIHDRFPYYENLPLAVKMAEGKSFEIEVNGKTKPIKNGNFITDTVGGKTIGKCSPEMSYMKAVFEGKSHFISQVYPSLLRGNPIFVISAPVKDAAGKLLGVAVVAPQMSYFTDIFIDKIKIGETGYIFFVDDRGMLIAHPEKDRILKKEAAQKMANITETVFKADSDFTQFEAESEGNKRFYCGKKVNIKKANILHDWYLVFTQDMDEINAFTNSFLKVLGRRDRLPDQPAGAQRRGGGGPGRRGGQRALPWWPARCETSAMRAAEAARNTSELIGQSQGNATEGVSASTEVEQILREIVDGIGKVADLIEGVGRVPRPNRPTASTR